MVETNTTQSSVLDTTPHTGKHGHPPHLVYLKNSTVSNLVPYTQLILTIILVVMFLIKYYLFEKFLTKKLYGVHYTKLNERNRRGFINHHIAGIIKILCLVIGCVPVLGVTFGKLTLQNGFWGSHLVTNGDILVVLSEMIVAMYTFELLYRTELSYVAVAHHIGAVVICQTGVACTVDWEHQVDSTYEFILICWWGAFDIIAEFWPHIAIVLYRIHTDNHAYMRKIFRMAFFSTSIGSLVETVVVMWLFGSLWDQWTIAFKVATPILHLVFTAAQVWGSWNFYTMWRAQTKKMIAAEKGKDVELGAGSTELVERSPVDSEATATEQTTDSKDSKKAPTSTVTETPASQA